MNGHRTIWLIAAAIAAALAFPGCAKTESASAAHDDHESHDEHDEHDEHEDAGASFDEDHGLTLAPEVARALALSTAKVEARTVSRRIDVVARVYTTTPTPLATAWVDAPSASALDASWTIAVVDAPHESATVQNVSPAAARHSGQVELIFAVFSPDAALDIGDSRTIRLTEPDANGKTYATVPASAVLDTATGTFVYLAGDASYRRVPVQTGPRIGDRIAIREGIDPTNTVVTAPVDQLWLTELRLTKGGGHSH